MKPYITDHESGVIAFESGKDYLIAEFRDGRTYLYDFDKPGKFHVNNMKKLAAEGTGLTGYINQHVRDNYKRKLK